MAELAHIDTGGSGTPLVLVHGLAGSKEAWAPFIERWRHRHRVIAVDLPGHGATPDDGAGVIGQLRGVKRLLEALDVPRPVVIGHSMGTTTALSLGARVDVAASVAIDPTLDTAAFALDDERDVRDVPADEFYEWARNSWVKFGINNIPEPTRSWVLGLTNPDRDYVLKYMQRGDVDPDRQAERNSSLASIAHPVTIVYGRSITAQERALAELIPSVQIDVWEDHGHYLHYVDIDRFVDLVEDLVVRIDR